MASHTLLVRDVAILFDARDHLFHKACLLAMACKIGQLRAAVRTQGRSKAFELQEERRG